METFRPPLDLVTQFRELADKEYRKDIAAYEASKDDSSSWVERTASAKGGATLKDRVASMVLLIQGQPVYKLGVLDELLALAGREKRIATMVGTALLDLLTENLLPSDRSLLNLSDRPLLKYANTSSPLSPKVLILWRFEELLKQSYQKVLAVLSSWLNDTLDSTKKFGLHATVTLLSSAPEQEQQLLTLAVNKLGDPSAKAAASAGHQLRVLLTEHPAMTKVVCREVQQLCHRPNLSARGVYACVIWLNQVKFTRGDSDLPLSLCGTYFKLFEFASSQPKPVKAKGKKGRNDTAMAAEEGGVKSRLLSALLTGVNRAHPYVPASALREGGHVDKLYRLVHTSPPSSSTQSLLLLLNFGVTTRFYRALYARLAVPEMYVGRSVLGFFNVVYRACKSCGADVKRAVCKRLLQVSMHGGANVVAAAVYLVGAVGGGDEGAVEVEGEYDPTARDPENSNADELWEAAVLRHHYHPSVSAFTSSLMDDAGIDYRGDPLRDFTTLSFLDRFAYRNPKSKEKLMKKFNRQESVAERRSGGRGLKVAGGVAVNDPRWMGGKVAENEGFYLRFFKERERRDKAKGVVRGKGTVDDEDHMDVAMEDAEVEALGGEGTVDWEEDSEEEEFAQGLAEKLMESAGNGRAHFDDEDVEFEMSSDEEDDVEDDDDIGGYEDEDVEDDDRDDDASDDYESDDNGAPTFEDASSDLEETSDFDDTDPINAFDDSEDDEDDGLNDEDDGDDDDTPRDKKRKKQTSDFADANEYQHDSFWDDRDSTAGEGGMRGGKKKRKTRRKSAR